MSQTEKSKASISKKINQLDTDVEWFYSEDFSLDQALDKYRAAIDLSKDIEKDLAELKNQVEVIADFTKS